MLNEFSALSGTISNFLSVSRVFFFRLFLFLFLLPPFFIFFSLLKVSWKNPKGFFFSYSIYLSLFLSLFLLSVNYYPHFAIPRTFSS